MAGAPRRGTFPEFQAEMIPWPSEHHRCLNTVE